VIWVVKHIYGHYGTFLEATVARSMSCYKSWEVYLGHREFVSTVVHMTVREQYPLLDIARICCLSKLPSPCKKYSCSCSYSMCTELFIELLHMHWIAHSWLPWGTLLVSSHVTMSTVAIPVKNIIAKITFPFFNGAVCVKTTNRISHLYVNAMLHIKMYCFMYIHIWVLHIQMKCSIYTTAYINCSWFGDIRMWLNRGWALDT